MPKDLFSKQAKAYASYRPLYPSELFQHIYGYVESYALAWDAGTGNGQTAKVLAEKFELVIATDISEQQLALATKSANIVYRKEAAEEVTLATGSADLVTASQAAHWFQLDKFYKKVDEVLKPGGCIALFGYGLIGCRDERVNEQVSYLYREITAPYWDAERNYVDDHYSTLPFPFAEIASPGFTINVRWNIDQLTGYLQSWSAVNHYIKANEKSPLTIIEDKLASAYSEGEEKDFSFPVFLRLGKKVMLPAGLI